MCDFDSLPLVLVLPHPEIRQEVPALAQPEGRDTVLT